MSKIITPTALWKDFDASLDVMPVSLGEKIEGEVKYEYFNFSGRDTGMGRVTVYGILASSISNPAHEGVLIMPDSDGVLDESLLKYVVEHGYTALVVDYAGRRDGAERYTRYPQNVVYANVAECGRYKDYSDYGAYKTCWYEWVSVGIYARKFLLERVNNQNIGLIGIRDGGEIAWKLACAAQFSCAVTVAACGWSAYKGYNKFTGKEPEFDDERYAFVAGVDSQAYAPYVKCPIMMLCTTGDSRFDYDRAFDTFSRINEKYKNLSVITYSLRCDARIDSSSTRDMFMFLDFNVKDRHVYIPKPADVKIFVDENENLVARVMYDHSGIIESCGVYYAEDSYVSSVRDWAEAPLKKVTEENESEFYINVYEKSSAVFVLAYVVYSNGFKVWSKVAYKRIGGKFRNSRAKCNIMYTNQFGCDCFTAADCSNYAVGGVFIDDDAVMPRIVTVNGLKGIYSECGLSTNRLLCPQFAPLNESMLEFDICPEDDMELEVILISGDGGKEYSAKFYIVGGVWQNVIQKAKVFKNDSGISLDSFTECTLLTFKGEGKYAINNLIWL